jgi:GMP synthase-like glutamine amidotransferase
MRAALIANSGDADPGFVGRSLRQRGFSFTEFIREYWEEWPSLDGIDLVVSMGSSWSTYWEKHSGPITTEQHLIRQAIANGIPVLGICFGGQQLATVLGGTVTNAQSPEIGWFRVENVPETAESAPKCLTEGPWMQWHYDRFSVPSGATVLAESPAGPQAIVCGRALGLQFHPEATESIVRQWSAGEGVDELASLKISPQNLLAETSDTVVDAERRCDELVAWFLDDVAQRHIHTP